MNNLRRCFHCHAPNDTPPPLKTTGGIGRGGGGETLRSHYGTLSGHDGGEIVVLLVLSALNCDS